MDKSETDENGDHALDKNFSKRNKKSLTQCVKYVWDLTRLYKK